MGNRILTVTLIALGMAVATPAMAFDHGGKEHGKGAWHGEDRDHDRDRDDHGKRGHEGRPPGWSKGKKTGWGNCNLPPGQAKKHGCYDRDDHIYARRHHHAVTRSKPAPRPAVLAHPAPRPAPAPKPKVIATTPTTTSKAPARRPYVLQPPNTAVRTHAGADGQKD